MLSIEQRAKLISVVVTALQDDRINQIRARIRGMIENANHGGFNHVRDRKTASGAAAHSE